MSNLRIKVNRDHQVIGFDSIKKDAILRLWQVRDWKNWHQCKGYKPLLNCVIVLNTVTGYLICEFMKISFSRRFIKIRNGATQQIMYIPFGQILNLHTILSVSKNNVSVDPYAALEICKSSI